jgi:hypothetical protein
LGPARGAAQNWISTNAAPRPILMIRLYQPTSVEQGALAALRLPNVTKVSCPGDAP